MVNASQSTLGAQSLRRALQILRILGENHDDGLTATQVKELTGLERSTAHRMLSCLAEESFAERDAITLRYRLGLGAMRLGFASFRRAPLVSAYQSTVRRIARLSEDTVFLMVRQGDFSVCMLREDGAYPVKIFSTHLGDVRPLGIGVGGMALLSSASDKDVVRIRQQHASAFEAAGLVPSQLGRVIARTRRNGYAEMSDTVTEGVVGVGATIPDVGQPYAAIAIAAIKPRMTTTRRAELGEMLVRELAQVGAGR